MGCDAGSRPSAFAWPLRTSSRTWCVGRFRAYSGIARNRDTMRVNRIPEDGSVFDRQDEMRPHSDLYIAHPFACEFPQATESGAGTRLKSTAIGTASPQLDSGCGHELL